MFKPLTVLLGLACLAPSLAAQETRPSAKPSTRPSTKKSGPPAKPKSGPTDAVAARPPARATGSKEAIRLARKILQHAGGKAGWERVDNVVFTFAGRRTLFWDRHAGKVRIESISRPGRRPGRGAMWGVLVYDVRKNEGRMITGSPGIGQRDPARVGKGIWINDTYWLLVTLKVLDPGVELAILPEEGAAEGVKKDDTEKNDVKKAGIKRLRLRFREGVGLTPKNQYVLHVEEATGKVVQWDYYRTADAKPRSWRFEGYKKVGPLLLSLHRPMVGTEGRALRLEKVAINIKPPKDIWTASGALLKGSK